MLSWLSSNIILFFNYIKNIYLFSLNWLSMGVNNCFIVEMSEMSFIPILELIFVSVCKMSSFLF